MIGKIPSTGWTATIAKEQLVPVHQLTSHPDSTEDKRQKEKSNTHEKMGQCVFFLTPLKLHLQSYCVVLWCGVLPPPTPVPALEKGQAELIIFMGWGEQRFVLFVFI